MKEVKYIPGDLVFCEKVRNQFSKENRICVVKYWSKSATYIQISSFIDNGWDYIVLKRDIKGLPLTPEILRQNGFKTQIRAETTSYYNTEYRLKLECSNSQNYIRYRVYYEDKCTSLNIKFAHQLQHLLFGLGLDSSLKV